MHDSASDREVSHNPGDNQLGGHYTSKNTLNGTSSSDVRSLNAESLGSINLSSLPKYLRDAFQGVQADLSLGPDASKESESLPSKSLSWQHSDHTTEANEGRQEDSLDGSEVDEPSQQRDVNATDDESSTNQHITDHAKTAGLQTGHATIASKHTTSTDTPLPSPPHEQSNSLPPPLPSQDLPTTPPATATISNPSKTTHAIVSTTLEPHPASSKPPLPPRHPSHPNYLPPSLAVEPPSPPPTSLSRLTPVSSTTLATIGTGGSGSSNVPKHVETSVAVLPLHDIRKLQERGQQRAQLLLLRHYLTEELGRCGPRPRRLVERARCYGESSPRPVLGLPGYDSMRFKTMSWLYEISGVPDTGLEY